MMSTLRRAAELAVSDGVPARALMMAAIIGTVLNTINQGDVILHAGHVNWLKLTLTYLTPYIVSTHGAVMVKLRD